MAVATECRNASGLVTKVLKLPEVVIFEVIAAVACSPCTKAAAVC